MADKIDQLVDRLLEAKFRLFYRLPNGDAEEFDTAETEQEAADKLEAADFDADDMWYEEEGEEDEEE